MYNVNIYFFKAVRQKNASPFSVGSNCRICEKGEVHIA